MMKIQNSHSASFSDPTTPVARLPKDANKTTAFSIVLADLKSSGEASGAGSGQSGGDSMSDGIVVAGQYYSAEEVKDFYANGGDDYAFARSVGLRDSYFIHNLALRARAIGGGPTGEQALTVMFKQYQASTPDGASADDYEAWKAHQGPALLDKIRAGTYVGAAIDPKDFEIGGIFAGQNASFRQNGLNPDGSSDKWIPNVGFAETAPSIELLLREDAARRLT